MRGLVRVGAAVPSLALGNVKENMKRHLAMMREAKEKHVSIVTFPELSLTGYTCGDLFFQRRLLDDVTDALLALKDEMPEGILAVVGAPLEIEGALYNCAVVLHKGEIISAVPKTFLPNNGEFYEKRWFQSGDARRDASVAIPKLKTDVCRQAIFETEDGVRFGIELCEDLWAPLPPSTMLSVEGAEIILNLSASNELLSKREYRQQLISQQSARCQCGYVYVSAGMGESSSDLVFSGHSVIASCGTVIRESEGYLADNYLMTADIDIDRICADRMKQSSFADCAAQVRAMWKQAPNILRTMENALLPDDAAPDYHVSKHPFIPSDKASRQLRCAQILAMQATALARRLSVTGGKVVVGISGGLDSTLALLAACKAVDMLHLPRTNILGITMPCFGTTDRTYHNALDLMTSPWGQPAGNPDSQRGSPAFCRHRARRERPLRHLRELSGARADAGADGRGEQNRRDCPWHRRFERNRAGLVHLQRRPHEHVWREQRRAQNAGALGDSDGGGERSLLIQPRMPAKHP